MAARNMERIEINTREKRTVGQVGYLQRLFSVNSKSDHSA
jgi:hypothetical protein